MPGTVLGSMSLISQIPTDFLGLSPSQWFWVAVAGWSLAIVAGGVLVARIGQVVPTPDLERVVLDTPALLEAIAPEEDVVGGVLRWLLGEVEADAVAFLELSPRGELLRIEPRGLDEDSVTGLAHLARSSLVGGGQPSDAAGVARWLGTGGSKVIAATGTEMDGSEEPFRFSRYLLEWVRAAERRERPGNELEDRLRTLPGVAWVEVVGRSARLLAAENANPELVRAEVARLLENTGVATEWIAAAEPPPTRAVWITGSVGEAAEAREEPGEPEAEADEAEPIATQPIGPDQRLVASAVGTQEPRIRLLDVVLSENGEATADVRVTWNEREIRGRGHGRPTQAGRYFAAAQAVADALRPLLDTDVVIEGLYVATTKEGVDVLISEVRMEGERYVGAVLERRDRPDWTGARAVLDAVNRRLVQLAGRSGRV